MKRSSVLAVFACLLLSACASQFAATPTPEPVTLRFAFLGNTAYYEELANQFHEEHDYITIELAPMSFQAGYNILNVLYEEFQRADVIRTNNVYLTQTQLDQVRPLEEFLESETQFKPGDIFPGLLEALQVDGNQMALPAGFDPVVMFYEKARFDIAGATPPGQDYTLDDFILAAQSVHNPDTSQKDEGRFSYGFCTTPYGGDPFIFSFLFGGMVIDTSGSERRPTLNSPANVDAMRWYTSLWSDYQIAPPYSDDFTQIFRLFSSSACGFWAHYIDQLGSGSFYGFDYRALPLPKTGIPGSRNWLASWDGYFMTRATPHPQEAWQWMLFIMERQEAAGDQIPPLVRQIASQEYAGRVTQDKLDIARLIPNDVLFSQLEDARFVELDGQVNNLYSEAVKRVIVDGVDVQEALDEAQAKAEAVYSSQEP
jgi:multiple sugar transport system substrate-binding protein